MMAYPFRHNQNLSQFELQLQDELAFVEYFTQDKKMYLTHTEVPGALRNQGIATQLIEQALAFLERQGWTLVPQCAFVSAYIDNHPEWHFLLSEGYQM